MYCQNCGSVLGQDAKFCQSCGKPQSLPQPLPQSPPPVPGPIPQTSQPQKRPKSNIFWLVMGGILLAIRVGMLGKSPSNNSTSTTTPQSSALTPQPQITRPSIPPPKFRIYKFKNDGISPTSVVVPVNTTDEQLKSLIWFFREKVRSHDFKSLGVREARDGILLVYRGKKCATEEIDITASAGPCGDGYHDDAFYQWGIEGDYNKDSGSIRVNGVDTVVFDDKDGWQLGH